MKYKIRNEKTFGKGILDIVLENRDLTKEEVKRLLNSNEDNCKYGFDIYGMREAVDFFNERYNKQLIIGILPDEDADGATSSVLEYKWLTEDLEHPKENIRVFFHKKAKSHGLNNEIFKDLLESDVDLFLIADSSTNDIKQQKQLVEKGKEIIILDHHNMEHKLEEIPNGVYLVNNNIGDSENKYLSGVGVVAKFIECLGYDIDKYLDIIAVGIVGDSMDMLDLQNRYYVNEGLDNINNDLIKAFFDKNEIENPCITDISYNVANMINAVIRFGRADEKELLWRAFIGEEGTIEYTNKKKEVVEQTLVDGLVRISGNIKSRQNNAKKSSIKKIEEHIYKHNLDKNKCIIIINDKDEFVEHSISGLVANSLCSSFKRPIIILSPYRGEWAGSVRSNVPNFKDMVNESGLVTFAQGHQQAFGVGLKKENIKLLQDYLNIKLRNIKMDEKITDVDYVFNCKDVKKEDIKEIADLYKLWCTTVEEPTFIVKGITLESKNITHKKGMKGYYTTFKHNDLTFTKNFSSKKVYEELTCKDQLKFGRSHLIDLTLLVKFKKGKYGYYCEIVDFNSCKSSKKNYPF